jgi:putative redox protein
MATSTIIYTGELRTVAVHLQSGVELITDAPTDNQGRGEAFSPTDLLATSLGACMLTIMGINAKANGIDIDKTRLEITKTMATNPRRVSEIKIIITFPNKAYSEKEKQMLQIAALNCPVAKSLHPEIKQNVNFIWD